MCLKDVQLGRAKSAERSVTVAAGVGPTSRILPGNPNRAALVVAAKWQAAVATGDYALIRSGNGAGPVVALLDQHNPYVVLNVEQFGSALTDSLWMDGHDANSSDIDFTEIVWLQPVEQI